MGLVLLVFVLCATVVALAVVLEDEAKDLVRAITERIRNPRPSYLEEMNRHWEESDRINKGKD